MSRADFSDWRSDWRSGRTQALGERTQALEALLATRNLLLVRVVLVVHFSFCLYMAFYAFQ
jgi:hypothetical protein